MVRLNARSCNQASTRPLVTDERGLSTVEYLILLVLIAVGSLTIWKNLGKDISDRLSGTETTFAASVPVPTSK